MKSLLILLSLICLYCSSENENNYLRNQDYLQKWEGWAGAPESINRKPYEYFYAIQKGNVKLKRLKPEQMEKACIDSVRENGLEKITLMLVGNIFDTMQDGGDYSYEPYIKLMITDFKRNKLKMEIKTCSSTAWNPKWMECECITYIYVPGGKDSVIGKLKSFEAK